jgi:PASTA domain
MARTHWIAVAVLWAGCSAAAQLGVTTRSTAGTPAAATSSGSAPSAPSAASAPGDPQRTVPDLTGKTLDEARAIVRAAGFTSELEDTELASCPGAAPGAAAEGQILCQDPDPGQHRNRHAPIQVVVYKPQRFAETALQQQLLALRGLTVDEARVQLRRIGHDGPVKVVRLDKHVSGCAPERVCDVGRGRARDLHDEITLWLNPRLDIAAPEP